MKLVVEAMAEAVEALSCGRSHGTWASQPSPAYRPLGQWQSARAPTTCASLAQARAAVGRALRIPSSGDVSPATVVAPLTSALGAGGCSGREVGP